MVIYEKRWKSSEDKKQTWNRAKVLQRGSTSNLKWRAKFVTPMLRSETMKIYENQCKSTKICKNQAKSKSIIASLRKPMKTMKYNKSVRRQENRAELSIGPGSRILSVAPGPKHPCSDTHEKVKQARSTMKDLRGQEISLGRVKVLNTHTPGTLEICTNLWRYRELVRMCQNLWTSLKI